MPGSPYSVLLVVLAVFSLVAPAGDVGVAGLRELERLAGVRVTAGGVVLLVVGVTQAPLTDRIQELLERDVAGSGRHHAVAVSVAGPHAVLHVEEREALRPLLHR